MARIYLFGSDQESESIQIIALLTKAYNNSQIESEKKLGMDFLSLLDDGTNLRYLANKYVLNDYGLTEEDLAEMASEYLNIEEEGSIELAEFFLDNEGYLNIGSRYVKNITKGNNRNSRRYILVEFDGRFYFTDVVGLNDATLNYKEDRERNEKGLQWGNYISAIKHGAIYA